MLICNVEPSNSLSLWGGGYMGDSDQLLFKMVKLSNTASPHPNHTPIKDIANTFTTILATCRLMMGQLPKLNQYPQRPYGWTSLSNFQRICIQIQLILQDCCAHISLFVVILWLSVIWISRILQLWSAVCDYHSI